MSTGRPSKWWIAAALVVAVMFALWAYTTPWFGAIIAAFVGFRVVVGAPYEWVKGE